MGLRNIAGRGLSYCRVGGGVGGYSQYEDEKSCWSHITRVWEHVVFWASNSHGSSAFTDHLLQSSYVHSGGSANNYFTSLPFYEKRIALEEIEIMSHGQNNDPLYHLIVFYSILCLFFPLRFL